MALGFLPLCFSGVNCFDTGCHRLSWWLPMPCCQTGTSPHDDVIKWKHFPRYWSFVRGIHQSQVISPHKGQWRGALMFSLICVWINGWVNNRETGDLRRRHAHYDVIVMISISKFTHFTNAQLSMYMVHMPLSNIRLRVKRYFVWLLK